MPLPRQLLGHRGIRVGARRWVLDRYRRSTSASDGRWQTGWVRAGSSGSERTVGVCVVGPRHGLALAHLNW